MVTKIYTDGSGASSYAGGKFCAVFLDENDKVDFIQYRESETELTCNEAEYHAVILALEERLNGEEIEIFSDSKLVVNQLKPENPWNINYEHLKVLNSMIKDIIQNFSLDVKFKWVPRDQNLAGLFLEGKLKMGKDIITTEW